MLKIVSLLLIKPYKLNNVFYTVFFFSVILGRSHYLLYALATAMQPRMLVTFDEDLNSLAVPVRVGMVSESFLYLNYKVSFFKSTLRPFCSIMSNDTSTVFGKSINMCLYIWKHLYCR